MSTGNPWIDAALASLGRTDPDTAAIAAPLLAAPAGTADPAPLAARLGSSGDVLRLLSWLLHKGAPGDPSLQPKLRALLADPRHAVQHDAAFCIESLAKQGLPDPEAVPGLVANLASPDDDARAASVFCLGDLARAGVDVSAAAEALRQLEEHDPVELVRGGARDVLAAIYAPRP